MGEAVIKQLTTEEMEKVYDLSPYSFEYYLLRQDIENYQRELSITTKPSLGEIACCYLTGLMDNKLAQTIDNLSLDRTYPDVFNMTGIKKISTQLDLVRFMGTKPIDNCIPLERYKAEYNPEFSQLCVAVIVKCYDGYVLLSTSKDNRISNKLTMVQGHVKFDRNCYLKTYSEILKDNIVEELKEETNITDIMSEDLIRALLTPSYLIRCDLSIIDLEHCGVIYTLNLPMSKDKLENLTTMEPEKHSVVILNEDEIKERIDGMDSWLHLAMKEELKL